MRQEKEYIKNIENFKKKFEKLRIRIEKIFDEENNKIYIDYILKNKEKIIDQNVNFKFNTFFVDGSMSKIGSIYPNFFYIFRSLSYSPNLNTKIYIYDLFSPLIDEDKAIFEKKLISLGLNEKSDMDLENLSYVEEYFRYVLMAKIEIEAAKESLNYLNKGDIIFMDGSLTHFKGECPIEFNELLKSCYEKDVIICGVVEDIGSSVISKIFKDYENLLNIGDKELLIGNLNEKEMLHIKDPINKEGFSLTFLRISKDPTPISFDLPQRWSEKYKEIASFLSFITESYGRGIPIFRDMSHEDVKLTEEECFIISKNFIKDEYLEKLFKLKRWLR